MSANDFLTLIGVGFWCGGAASWLFAVVNMFRMVSHRKPDVPLFPNWYESPFNIMFRPNNLTDKGLKARRNTFIGVAGFFGCAVGFVAIAGLV